jgi:two-component system chemotaxis response regulator CheB
MSIKRLVVIGASAGGIEALKVVAAALPADLPAAVCVVLHTAPDSPGVLGDILNRAGALRAANALNGERLQHGRIYVAPPDRHLLIEPGVIRVTKGPTENRFRPAVDPLFRSAAQVYGPAAVGVILTGNLDDGTAGLWALKQLGGIAIVQDPGDAMYPSMPHNAMQHTKVDYSVPLHEMAPLIGRVVATAPDLVKGDYGVPEHINVEVNIAKEQNAIDAGIEQAGTPSSFACPECHGVLLQLKEAGRVRFRCHTGHAYSVESLLAGVSSGIEEALWNAIRALEEGSLLLTELSQHIHQHSAEAAAEFSRRSSEAHRHSNVIRQLAAERQPMPDLKRA